MTENEKRNVAAAHRYIELYNNDIDRFVPDCYTDDCRLYAMGGGVIEGPTKFLKVEHNVLRVAPRRRTRLDPLHLTGDVVTVEVTLLDPDAGDDWALLFVAVLTMRDGKIAIDRSYADWSRWPGLAL